MADSDHQLILNLNLLPHPGLDAQIWAAPRTEDGGFSVVTQRVTTGNARDFGFRPGDPLDILLRTADDLTTTALIRHILKNPKRLPDPVKFQEDDRQKAALRKRADRLIDQWLALALTLGLPVTLGIDRMGIVASHQLHVVVEPVVPRLRFVRTGEGMTYRLTLPEGHSQTGLTGRALHVLANLPGWVILDRFLLRTDGVEAGMLKPFAEKEELHIPNRMLKSYIQKFLMKASRMAEVEAEGFEIRSHRTIRGVALRTLHHVFRDEAHLSLDFDYGGVVFPAHDQTRSRQAFSDPDHGPLVIDRYERDADSETRWTAILGRMGLEPEAGGTWRCPDALSLPDLTDWLIRHKPGLEAEGLSVVPPVTPAGTAILAYPDLKKDVDVVDNDWFDLKDTVILEDRRFPFVHLGEAILRGDRFFPLDDDRAMLIPAAWLAEYRDHFVLGEVVEDRLRVTKAQFLSLSHTPPTGEGPTTLEFAIPDIDPPTGLRATLRPYQLYGFRWLAGAAAEGLGVCLADDMGLGKTLQTIALLLHLRQGQDPGRDDGSTPQLDLFSVPERPPLRALIVLPASLVFNWKEELRRFAPDLNVYVHTGPERYQDARYLLTRDVILTTYAVAVRDADMLRGCPFTCLVLDESQQIKNHRTRTFQAIRDLRADFRLALTGTPVENSLSDLWSQMQFINPGLLGAYEDFREHYQKPIEKDRDPDREVALRQLVRPFLLRRRKQEVAPDLPPLTEQVVWCDMTEEQARVYEEEKSAVRNLLLNQLRTGQSHWAPAVLNALMRLRQIAFRPAVYPEYADIPSGKEEVLRNELDNLAKGGQQALVYSAFRRHIEATADWLTEQGQPWSILHGGVPVEQRGQAVAAFQDGRARFFLATLKAGGAGLNLTRAEYILLADPWWNPAVEDQAIGRGHRIGQEKPVFALRFITRGTVEEKILALQQRKAELRQAVLDEDKVLDTLDASDLLFLVDADDVPEAVARG